LRPVTQSLPASRLAVAQACDLFLEHAQRHTKQKTYEFYKSFLQSFCDLYGTLPVRSLKPLHVTRWLDGNAWNPTTRHGSVSCVKRAIHYAIAQGVLADDPLKALKKDRPLRRERIVTDEERTLIYRAVKDQSFQEFLFALQESGARPGVVRRVSREHVNLGAGVWVFGEHKTKGATGRPRVVYLTPALVELTRTLLARVPDGPLFRNSHGEPWTRDAVVQRLARLRKRYPQLEGVVAVSYRHSFTTDGLERGVPIATMAELLGHTTTRMIDQNYGHLAERRDHLRRAVATVRPGTLPAGIRHGGCSASRAFLRQVHWGLIYDRRPMPGLAAVLLLLGAVAAVPPGGGRTAGRPGTEGGRSVRPRAEIARPPPGHHRD
jgi:integrase